MEAARAGVPSLGSVKRGADPQVMGIVHFSFAKWEVNGFMDLPIRASPYERVVVVASCIARAGSAEDDEAVGGAPCVAEREEMHGHRAQRARRSAR